MSKNRIRPGYTLLEVTLAVVVVAIIGAVSIPYIQAMYGHDRVLTAADSIRAGLADARSHAMIEGRAYRVAVVPNTGNFRVAPDSPAYWSGSGSGNSSSSEGAWVQAQKLPNGICFTIGSKDAPVALATSSRDDGTAADVTDLTEYSSTATFLPDGSATEDKEITLSIPGSKPVVLKLRAATGTVTLEQ